MTIAIIGAGFTGLSSAYTLLKQKHNVTVFEKDPTPGGLAIGFSQKNWEWTLEKYYHHWFTNDKSVLDLAKETNYPVITKRPKTSTYIDGSIYQLDSTVSLLKFPKLSIPDRIRMGIVLGLIKYNPFWQILENIKAAAFLSKTMGKKAYQLIWEPLFINKFGKYASDVSLAWFWARIVKRTPSLAYPKGGFLEFANALVKKIEKKGGKVLFNTEVKEIRSEKEVRVKFARLAAKREIRNLKLEIRNFDRVIVTLPSYFFVKIAPQLPDEYKNKLLGLK